MKNMQRDLSIFGENEFICLPEKNRNENVLVVGSTGSGKTTSITEPKILHTFNMSLVIPIVKRELYYLYEPLLKSRGYKVLDLNLAIPQNSTLGYDPMRTIHSEKDIMSLARQLVAKNSRTLLGESDPYWSESTTSAIAAEIGLVYWTAKKNNRIASFQEVLNLHKNLIMNFSGSKCQSSLDEYFDILEEENPKANAPKLWRTIRDNASKTSACIYSMMNSLMDKFMEDDLSCIFSHKNQLNIKDIGEEKIALFITTSPILDSGKLLSDLLYANLFKSLFESAYENKNQKLKYPVHIIADDFACGSKIPRFSEYISVFRGIGISCTILLQSLSQLELLYGKYEAQTIMNNCDTFVYLSCSDINTAKDVSIKMNISVTDALSIPIGSIVLSRRGEKARIIKRYDTYHDEYYKNLICKSYDKLQEEYSI